jgi:hypothetical protein
MRQEEDLKIGEGRCARNEIAEWLTPEYLPY